MCPSDLGLKAGFWTRETKDPLEFREIVGWVTIMSRDVANSAGPENGFHAVVLDDTMYPMVARIHPRYCGVFLMKLSEDEAKALVIDWMKPKEGTHAQPNMSGIGVA